MVAELLRLNLRLGLNHVRSSPWIAIRAVVAALAVIAVLAALVAGAFQLRELDAALARRVVIVAGSALSLLVFLLPAAAAQPELLDRPALRGYGLRPSLVAGALLLTTLAGPALVLLVPFAALPLLVWGGDSAEAAIVAAVLLALQLVLTWRIGRAVGAALRSHPRWRFATRAIAVVAALLALAATLLAILPRLVVRLGDDVAGVALGALSIAGNAGFARLDDVLAGSPLGALWAAPAPETLRAAALDARGFAIGAVTLVVLAALWVVLVRAGFRATWRTRAVRKRGVPGAFRIFGSTPTGATTARSFTYWIRDPRYRSLLVFLPVIPVVMLLAAWVAGLPLGLVVLLPLPVMLLLVGWGSLHNDVAYDSTAMWTLLAAQVDGRADRLGRAVPVLTLGALLLAAAAPLVVWAHGDLAVTPIVVGTGLAVLLGAVGVSSTASVRSPYPAPRPGDGAFQQPENVANGGDAQAASLLLTILIAAPAFAAGALWLLGWSGPWNWVSLGAGVVCGLAAVVLGVRAGGRDFDRAGPELLAFTMRN